MSGPIRHNGEIGYRSSSWDDVQGYEDLRMLWGNLREIGRGKREPLKQEVMDRIAVGLERTVHEGGTSRIRLVASAIVLAIDAGDYERDVYRTNSKRS